MLVQQRQRRIVISTADRAQARWWMRRDMCSTD